MESISIDKPLLEIIRACDASAPTCLPVSSMESKVSTWLENASSCRSIERDQTSFNALQPIQTFNSTISAAMNRYRSTSQLSVSSSSPEPIPFQQELQRKKQRIIATLHANEIQRMGDRQTRPENELQSYCRRAGIKHHAADTHNGIQNRKLQHAASVLRDADDKDDANNDVTDDDVELYVPASTDDMKKKCDDDEDEAKPTMLISAKNDCDVVQERMTKFPPRELSGSTEREQILRDMKEFISLNPQANSHWLNLVKRFDIGYVQATQMRSKVLQSAGAAGGKVRRRRMKPELRKTIKDWTCMFPNSEWLSRQRREEIREKMKRFIAKNPSVNSNWKILALRFNIGYQQAVDIRNELNQSSIDSAKAATSSTETRRRLFNPIGRADELLRHYPKRRWSREERTRCKHEMTDLLLDHPELNNRWATLADKFQLGYEQVMELRKEIQEQLGIAAPKNTEELKPPKISKNERLKKMQMKKRRRLHSSTGDNSDDSVKEIAATTAENTDSSNDADDGRRNSGPEGDIMQSVSKKKKKIRRLRLESSDDESNDEADSEPLKRAETMEVADVPPAASAAAEAIAAAAASDDESLPDDKQVEEAKKLASDVAKLAKLYGDEQQRNYDKIAGLLNMPIDRVKLLIKRYLCHLIDNRLQKAVNGNLSDVAYQRNKYSLNESRVSQLQRVLRWMPRASIMQIAEKSRQEPGVIRALMLHKLRMWRRNGDKEDDDDDDEAVMLHGGWRRASAQEISDNGLMHVELINRNNAAFSSLRGADASVEASTPSVSDDDDDLRVVGMEVD